MLYNVDELAELASLLYNVLLWRNRKASCCKFEETRLLEPVPASHPSPSPAIVLVTVVAPPFPFVDG